MNLPSENPEYLDPDAPECTGDLLADAIAFGEWMSTDMNPVKSFLYSELTMMYPTSIGVMCN